MVEKILILGNSPAGAKAAAEIKKAQPASEVSIVLYDEFYPYVFEKFGTQLDKKSNPADILYQSKDFYKKEGINLVLGQECSRINLKRKKVHLEDRTQLDFDKLLITELPGYRFPEIKGYNKTGVVGFRTLSDIEVIKKQAILSDVIVIEAVSSKVLELAAKITQYNKEVYVICKDETLFKEISLDKVHFVSGTGIQEVLGDAEVKAVRLSSGKVIAADLVIVENIQPDFRIFSDEDIVLNKTFPMKSEFETQLEGVYVFPGLISGNSNMESLASLENLGIQVALQMLNVPSPAVTQEVTNS